MSDATVVAPRAAMLARLAERDREWFDRWSLSDRRALGARCERSMWVAVTHCGGVTVSVSAVLLPLCLSGVVHAAAVRAAIALALSHLAVHVIKRCVARQRPSRATLAAALIAEPKCSSFPSGHATSSMTVGAAYAAAFPHFAAPLLAFAWMIGFSRVRLRVHYPGDVLAGQAIAIATVVVVLWWR